VAQAHNFFFTNIAAASAAEVSSGNVEITNTALGGIYVNHA
jgi:hypothetical protein